MAKCENYGGLKNLQYVLGKVLLDGTCKARLFMQVLVDLLYAFPMFSFQKKIKEIFGNYAKLRSSESIGTS